jgi:PAS domain S-box-containing protein
MVDADKVFADAPIFLDVVTRDGRILFANGTQESGLGYEPGSLSGMGIEAIYPKATRIELERLFSLASAQTVAEFVTLSLRQRDRTVVEVAANINFFEDSTHGLCARLAKFSLGKVVDRLNVVERENEVLSSITETARDATWCIEFVEPVDLTAPDREIIRQVFENECFWRYCNDAMAQLYRLDSQLDFNQQDVREVFPRNADNEEFVQELINRNFNLDGAPSRDQRYDGRSVVVENDVRAHILNGQLHRMWGTVRDLSKQKLRERELLDQASNALDVLAATPDPIIVVNDELRIEAANPAVEWCFGWSVEKVLGVMLSDLLDLAPTDARALTSVGAGQEGRWLVGQVACRDGRMYGCDVHVAAFPDDDPRRRLVLAIRANPAAATRYREGVR